MACQHRSQSSGEQRGVPYGIAGRRSSVVERLFCKQRVAGSNPVAGSRLMLLVRLLQRVCYEPVDQRGAKLPPAHLAETVAPSAAQASARNPPPPAKPVETAARGGSNEPFVVLAQPIRPTSTGPFEADEGPVRSAGTTFASPGSGSCERQERGRRRAGTKSATRPDKVCKAPAQAAEIQGPRPHATRHLARRVRAPRNDSTRYPERLRRGARKSFSRRSAAHLEHPGITPGEGAEQGKRGLRRSSATPVGPKGDE